MRWTIAYSEIKKWNLVLINNATYQRETLSDRPIRQPLNKCHMWLFGKGKNQKKNLIYNIKKNDLNKSDFFVCLFVFLPL